MTHLYEPVLFADGAMACSRRPGRVTLAGAGPGDPDLLTVRAVRAIAQARLVLHDQLVGDRVLALLPGTARCIDVGKRAGCHTLSQPAIIDLMIRLARSGRDVLRLKGGDPTIFGRGGEEAEALAAAGVPFEIVPGISAAQGAAALAGMPLTHRDHAQSVVFATGHLQGPSDARDVDLDWPTLARPRQTVVIYMGVGALPSICRQLIAHGRAPTTPAAIVERISSPRMRTVAGTLASLPGLAQEAAVKPPGLIVVGEVVALRERLLTVAAAAAVPGAHG